MRTGGSAEETVHYSSEWLSQQDPSVRREVLEELSEVGPKGDREENIALLAVSLKDENPGVQQTAVNGLARIGGDRVAQRMVGLLREPPAVRNMAIEVIEQLVPETLDSTLPVLESKDPNVRKLMVDALGKQADPRVVQPLVKLLEDPNPNVRASAAESLGHVRARAAVPALVVLLRDEEWVAFSAAAALAEIGDATALPPLLDLLKQDREAVRYAAIEAIAALDRAGITALPLFELVPQAGAGLRPALIKTLVAITESQRADLWSGLDKEQWLGILVEMLADEDPEVRLAAMTGLGLLGDRRGTKAILNVYRQLSQPSDEVADLAVRALVRTGDRQALVDAVRQDEDSAGAIAIRALGELRACEAVVELGAVRRASLDWNRRRLAIIALGLIATEQALALVAEAIDDQTGYVRLEAVRILGESDRAPAVKLLLARLKTERYREVRDEIVETLVRVSGHDVMVQLVGLLQDSRSETREAAARAIGLARLPEGLVPLMDAMNDAEWRVRQAVVEAIGQYQDERALHSLLLALSDGHERVRLASVFGLARWDSPEAREALINQCLRDSDVWVRYRTVERLGHHRVTDAVPVLVALLEEEREPALVRRAIQAALASIEGDEAGDTLGVSATDGGGTGQER